jgi:hypothetical protein
MAQDFSDLAHAGTGAEHRPGETVPKQVGTLKPKFLCFERRFSP